MAAHPEVRLRQDLRVYGLTVEAYEALLAAQGGVCAICRRPPAADGRQKRLHVDHDHATDAVRGLLCSNCNTALGLLDDDVDRIAAAIFYLRGALG